MLPAAGSAGWRRMVWNSREPFNGPVPDIARLMVKIGRPRRAGMRSIAPRFAT